MPIVCSIHNSVKQQNYVSVVLRISGVTVPGPSIDDAKKMLRLAVATGLNFDVQYPTIEEVDISLI